MKKISTIVLLVLASLFTACKQDAPSSKSDAPLKLLTSADPEWQYENLRIYPVVADAALQQQNQPAARLKTLAEAMKTPGFRLMEQKQFGRSEDRSYNWLTVASKVRDTVYMLSGDVVTGGKQDRVIQHDQIVMPGTVRNVEVFCVEQGRWAPRTGEEASSGDKVYAFSGYYNVASPTVRQAVQRSGSQREVWSAVAKVTSANEASSATSTYAALDQENAQKAKRDACLNFFQGKFQGRSDVVGMVVVCGDRVLGVDIFGHSDLFARQYASLLHGYVAEAAAAEAGGTASEAEVRAAFERVAHLSEPDAKPSAEAGKFALGPQAWVHLYQK